MSSRASDQSAGNSTFVFADLAGFTALTVAHGDIEAIEIVTRFTTRVRSLLSEHHAEQIKTIGDEVMIRQGVPPMLFLFLAWGALLVFHLRVVRRVL